MQTSGLDVRENARRQLREMATALNDLADAVGDLGPMAESTLLVEAEKVIALAGQLACICRGDKLCPAFRLRALERLRLLPLRRAWRGVAYEPRPGQDVDGFAPCSTLAAWAISEIVLPPR